MNNDTKNRLADRVLTANAEALLAMACPACGGGLDVRFVRDGKKGKGAGSVSVMCAKCIWRVVSDGIPSEPPRVHVVGSKFHTVGAATTNGAKKAKPTVTA